MFGVNLLIIQAKSIIILLLQVIIFANNFTKKEFLLILFLVILIVGSLLILEYSARKNILNHELARKILHIIAVSVAGYSFLIISNQVYLVAIGIVALLILFPLVKYEIISSLQNRRRKSFGIIYVAVSYLLLSIMWDVEYKWIVFPSMLILAFADSFAAIIGGFFANKYFKATGDEKSYIGSVTFFIVTIFILLAMSFIARYFLNENQEALFNLNEYYLLSCIIIAIILTVIEAISTKGIDNLFVPITASILLYFFIVKPQEYFVVNFSLAIVLASFISFISYKIRILTMSGSMMTFLLATVVYGFGELKWTLPIFTFFILSSLLSKFRIGKNSEVENYFEKSEVRDHWQVIANGGFAGILVIINKFFNNDIYYLMYLASIASVCADTWSTEIGTMRKNRTFNILNFHEMQQGISGGVSFIGTLGGFCGALVIALSGINWIDRDYVFVLVLISIIGLMGSIFDSVIGILIQAQYKCVVCSKITEKQFHCGQQSSYHKGIKIFNNDLVNFSTSLFGALILLIIEYIG